MTKEVTIENSSGLHARPAQQFVQAAQQFSSEIKIGNGEQKVDGKSILGLMTLALGKGTTVTIEANGEDEQRAVDSLVKLVESKFGEE